MKPGDLVYIRFRGAVGVFLSSIARPRPDSVYILVITGKQKGESIAVHEENITAFDPAEGLHLLFPNLPR